MMMYGVNAVSKEVNPTMQYLVEHRPTAGKFANRPFSFVVPFAEQGMQIAEAILCQEIKFIAQPKILREERNASGGKTVYYKTGTYPRKHFSTNVKSGTVSIIPVNTRTGMTQ